LTPKLFTFPHNIYQLDNIIAKVHLRSQGLDFRKKYQPALFNSTLLPAYADAVDS
jgi:hypothetical protein